MPTYPDQYVDPLKQAPQRQNGWRILINLMQ
jgi:hypothetical protein